MNELTINQHSLAHIKFSANWKDETGQHTAIQHFEKFNAWRDMDLLPETLAKEILGHQSGQFKTQMETGGLLEAGVLNRILLYVTALMEVKSAMGVIVAAPTAGSCAAMPGA